MRTLPGKQEINVLKEDDEAFFLELNETKDKKFTIFYSTSRSTSEIWYVDRVAPKPVKIISKKIGTRYFLEHNKGFFYVITNRDSDEFRLLRFSVKGSINQAEVVLEGDFLIDELDMYENNIVIYTRCNGVPVIKLFDINTLQVNDLPLPYNCKSFSIQPGSNLDYSSNEFTFIYSSPSVYEDTLCYNFDTKVLKIINKKRITGQPLRLENVKSSRFLAPSFDGTLIPITVVSHKDMVKDGKNRVLLKGYGAYGQKTDHSFKYSEAVAVDQGWTIVTSHVRGEGEGGLTWHKSATKEDKFRSFEDLIACAYFLLKENFTRKHLLAGYGCSAGGLLMAQVMNMKPDLFAAMVLEVPFVDPLSEMLNPDLPLSVTDRDEWGDPLKVTKK
jgi:oligopeptidase B